MVEIEQLKRLLDEQVPTIDRMVGRLCRRYGIAPDDVADVASWIKLRLVENDYEILRKFRGESSIQTYLSVVVAMQFRDFRAQKWGRWRPSAAARRRGAAAVRLETLVLRDKMPLREAAEALRTSGDTALTDRELATLLAEFPTRDPLRPIEVGADSLASQPATISADALVWAEAAGNERQALLKELDSALSHLAVEDQVILRLRFWEDMGVADVARSLGLDAKPLYRRIERALADVRARLLRAGVSRAAVALLAEPTVEEIA